MQKIFVDTNYFIRHFVGDDPVQTSRARKLFKDAETGKVLLATGPPVLFEMAWTLKKLYKKDKNYIIKAISAVASLNWLEMPDKALVMKAVSLAESTGQDFADAYIHTMAESLGASSVATFNNSHFARMGTKIY
jgi:predicted nucleic acid-binding protein